MTVDVQARPASYANPLPARSGLAGADVQRARNTLVELTRESRGLEDAGGRVLARLRRFVVGDAEELHSRS